MDLDGDDFFDPRIRNVIVLDDLMSIVSEGPENQRSLYQGKSSPKLEDDILSDQMDTSNDDMQSDRMDSLEEDPLARGDEDMEGGGNSPKRRKVETGMTNLQLKGYPATVCCAD